MKYRQRIYAVLALFLMSFIVFRGRLWMYLYEDPIDVQHQQQHNINKNERSNDRATHAVSFTQIQKNHKVCTNENGITSTVDYTVDDFYVGLNFTLGKAGLYDVHEKDKRFSDPKRKKILQRSEPLTIIVVPHSHNDPGWLWTLQRYYTERTQFILSNAVKFLTRRPDFRMIWSETIFLKMWWDEASSVQKQQFRKLLEGGQIEILSGGWVSVDEATTHYTAVLDQLIEGHQWLNEALGVQCNISWSIDPFGYSMTLPYLWRKAGMKNMAILRIHGAVKSAMGNRQLLTFNWRQQWDKLGKHDMLCHVEPYTLYNFEYSCGPDMEVCKITDYARYSDIPDTNIPLTDGRMFASFGKYVEQLVMQYRLKASQYKHNVILMPHGDDFRYIYEYEWEGNYNNMQKIMNYVNSQSEWNVQMKFGTVGEYFDLLRSKIETSKEKEPSISGDFFTYTDRDNEYWSGYYTTRPFDKRNIRKLLELIKMAEVLTSYAVVFSKQHGNRFSNLFNGVLANLQDARRTHGLVQHHDAITGTSAHTTVIDFRVKILDALTKIQNVIVTSLQTLIWPTLQMSEASIIPLSTQTAPDKHAEESVAIVTEQGTRLVFVNSYTQARQEIASVKVNEVNVQIYNEKGIAVDFQIAPCWSQNTILSSEYKVYFELSIRPMATVIYTIRKVLKLKDKENKLSSVIAYNKQVTRLSSEIPFVITEIGTFKQNAFSIANKHIKAEFSSTSGTLRRLCNIWSHGESCSNVSIDWLTYQTGNSNAYCFGTKVDQPRDLLARSQLIKVIKGKLITQVVVTHDLFNHEITLYHTGGVQGRSLHVNNAALFNGETNSDKELILRLATDIHNKDVRYFTDSNGFQLVSRQYRSSLPFGANFYPMTSMAVLENENRRLTVHSAQAHGVGSMESGKLLFMIDRVPTSSGKGLDEPIMDNVLTQSKFVISLEDKISSQSNAHSRRNQKTAISPSLHGHVTNDILQSPIEKFVILEKAAVTNSSINMFKRPFPPDYAISNVKTFLNKNLDFVGTGLTIHRRATSCLFEESDINTKTINFHQLFTKLLTSTVKKMSLTYLKQFESILNEDIAIDVSEMESFYINWKS